MARIRTIKPEFFRHEGLQDLEIANPGMYSMMVFEALWGHCDNKGVFEWKPRQLKLDILPFLPFDMAETLDILAHASMVKKYEVDGKTYGKVETFEKHQRISGKEFHDGDKFPDVPSEVSEKASEVIGKQRGSIGEIPESQEGKGRERNIAQTLFDAFWISYPKKKSKGDAEKAWLAIKPNEHLADEILQAVERAKTSVQWQEQGGKFIPYPASWLRDKGWFDEQKPTIALVPSRPPKPDGDYVWREPENKWVNRAFLGVKC